MRSSKREDLNIQSNFTSSFLSKSCRLPREQCSVTTANTEQSEKKPRKGFTFSFLRSFICQCRPTRVRTRSAVQYNSAGLLSTIKSSFFPGLHFFSHQYFYYIFFTFGHLICVSYTEQKTYFSTFVKILVVLCFTSLKWPSWNFFNHTQSPWKRAGCYASVYPFYVFIYFYKGEIYIFIW